MTKIDLSDKDIKTIIEALYIKREGEKEPVSSTWDEYHYVSGLIIRLIGQDRKSDDFERG